MNVVISDSGVGIARSNLLEWSQGSGQGIECLTLFVMVAILQKF
jgi:hypothetical protein